MKDRQHLGILFFKYITLLGLVLQMTGCGTVISFLQNDYRVYAGVEQDLQTIQEGGIFGVFAMVDLPFSFMLDTLLLPMTLSYE